ncbi:MAG: vitamin K epoxide reductase family protein [Patescibacteria group bacterium]
MISKTLLNKPLVSPTKKAIALGIFSFVGLLDASYLAVKHYTGTIPPCAIAKGCETVTTSQYATIGGVSVALFGAIYYLIILITSIALIDTGNNFLKKFLSKFSIIGLIASIWFVSLQLFVIKALCLYCIASATSSVAIFTVAFFLNRQK